LYQILTFLLPSDTLWTGSFELYPNDHDSVYNKNKKVLKKI